MATYVLIHGAGDVGWYWLDDDSAGLLDYADVVVDAIGERSVA